MSGKRLILKEVKIVTKEYLYKRKKKPRKGRKGQVYAVQEISNELEDYRIEIEHLSDVEGSQRVIHDCIEVESQ